MKKKLLANHNISALPSLYNDIYRKNGLFNEVKKPDGSFPGFALPRWLYWSLDQKLPQHPNLPPGSFYWSRGYLGDPVLE